MADNRDITFKINVDNKSSQKNIKEIDDSVGKLTTSIGDLEKVTMVGFDGISDTIEGTSDSYKGLADKADDVSKSQEKLEKSSGGANKGLGLLSKGAKGVGVAFKAMGIGVIVALFASLWEALQRNQKVMDAVNVVVTSVSIIFNKLVDALVKTWEQVSEATGGFDAMKLVVVNLLKIALTPLKLTFLGIKVAVQAAQLAWEKSMFGGKDANKIKELTSNLNETKEQIKEAGVAAIDAGKLVASNIGEAIGEVATLVKTTTTNVSDAVSEMSISAIVAQAKIVTEGANNIERLNILLERQGLISKTNAEVQRQLRDDENASFEERIEANTKLGKILDAQSKAQIDLIDKKMKIAKAELQTNTSNIELQNQILQLENDRLAVQEEITGQRSEQLVNQTALEKEQEQKRIEQEQERIERAKADSELLLQIYGETELKKLERLKKAQELELEQTLLSKEEKRKALLKIKENYDNQLKELDDAKAEEDKERDDGVTQHKIDNLNSFLGVFSQVMDLATQISEIQYQKQFDSLERSKNEELKQAGNNEAKKAAIEKKYAKEKALLEYEQAKSKKTQSIIDAIINTALAVSSALAVGPPAGYVMAAISGALGVAQIALISSQTVPKPTYGKGGVLSGNSHANGGIATPFGEVEGGEGIINVNAMNNPSLRNIASAVNVSTGGNDFSTGGSGGGIELSPTSLALLASAINSKQVVLNQNELSKSNEEIELVNEESYL